MAKKTSWGEAMIRRKKLATFRSSDALLEGHFIPVVAGGMGDNI